MTCSRSQSELQASPQDKQAAPLQESPLRRRLTKSHPGPCRLTSIIADAQSLPRGLRLCGFVLVLLVFLPGKCRPGWASCGAGRLRCWWGHGGPGRGSRPVGRNLTCVLRVVRGRQVPPGLRLCVTCFQLGSWVQLVQWTQQRNSSPSSAREAQSQVVVQPAWSEELGLV